ncbi:PLC-like phosphodiesterase [Gautieria morchelliformis]|nr:PLC-like phosphodiesterase [Gautieria morchelliformis]
MLPTIVTLIATALAVAATPYQGPLSLPKKTGHNRFFDIQAHRGGRANTIESTLPAFAWGLIEGSTTLELDNGITKDGVVVIWHDLDILPSKCRDTGPAFPDDPAYPYVGKFIANLTLSQIKTLDCSKRQQEFPLQLVYPRTRISTLQELFDFLDCADPHHHVLLNIESKINAVYPNETHDVQTFVQKQHDLFLNSRYYRSITYQSFDWRTLIQMKHLDPTIITSALVVDPSTFVPDGSTVSPWLGGVDLSQFDGATLGERIAQGAHSIEADILSPSATSASSRVSDPESEDYVGFTTPEMVKLAHDLGLAVKPWTVNRLNIVEQLVDMGVDGIISDAPDVLRRWAQQHKLSVAPRYPKYQVLACLANHQQAIRR